MCDVVGIGDEVVVGIGDVVVVGIGDVVVVGIGDVVVVGIGNSIDGCGVDIPQIFILKKYNSAPNWLLN